MPGAARGTVWQMWLLLPPSREPGQQKHRSCSAFTLQRIPAPLAQGWEQAPSLPQETPAIAQSHIQEMPARVWPDPALLVAPSASSTRAPRPFWLLGDSMHPRLELRPTLAGAPPCFCSLSKIQGKGEKRATASWGSRLLPLLDTGGIALL